MSQLVVKLFEKEGGEFISPPSLFSVKLKKIKALLFDWDGVFNNGFKNGSEGSAFSEVDAMGTNMLRYAFWRSIGKIPISAIMTGENNPAALHFAKRENFNVVYSKIKHKSVMFAKFCETYKLQPSEVLFFFDDVLDLEVARICGCRIMINRSSTVMLKQYVKRADFVDYVTKNDGGNHGVREGSELNIGLLGQFDEVINNRMVFSENYKNYLADRKKIELVEQEDI